MELVDIGNIALRNGLSPMAAMAAMAIAQTEAGLNGAVGDNGNSFGPFQFYAGGQLKNFAREMGLSLAEAGHLARTNPELAATWALRPGGYLGDTLRSGERQGIRGADLATYAQNNAQGSIMPERSGKNYQSLFGDYDPANGPAQEEPQPTRLSQPVKLSAAQAQALIGGGTPSQQQPTRLSQPVKLSAGWGSLVDDDDSGFMGTAARPSQWTMGGQLLTKEEAARWCGPAAAMAFAASYGRNPTLAEAKQMATSVGWGPQGMAGPASESKLLTTMGVPNDYQPWSGDWSRVQQTVKSGKPTILSTPGHYFYATDYDPQRDAYYVGTSGTDLTGGSDWLTPQQMTGFAVSGPIQGAIYGL